MSVYPDVPVTIAPKYARFSRRFRGIMLDWMILMAILFGALTLASMVRNDNFARVLGILVIPTLLLYEPVLVSSPEARWGTISPICASSMSAAAAMSVSSRPVPAS
jgi:hypothetical protein